MHLHRILPYDLILILKQWIQCVNRQSYIVFVLQEMTSSSHEHIKPIHHIVMQGNLSHGEIKNEMNKKIINTDQFCNVDIKILKTEDSPLSIFSKRLQHSLKQKQKQWSKHIKDRKNSFLKEQELKIKQTKKILIIQQKLKSQSGFSLKVRASNKEEKLKANKSEKKRSFEQKSVEKIPLISYPVERMTGFRKKLMEYLDNEEVRNVDLFQSMHRRKSMQKRAKIQPIQVQSKLRIETQPGNLGQVYFVVPTNFSESKKKIEKKNSVVFEVSKQYKASSFRRFSKDNPKEQKVEQKQRQLIGNLKQKHKVSINKQGSISPWNQQLSGQQF